MKNLYLPLFACMLLVSSIKANEPIHPLQIINQQWSNHPDCLAQVGEISFSNDIELIQQHLLWVHHFLSLKEVSHLSEAQIANRNKSLGDLYSYAKAGVFPINNYVPGRRPVFIDEVGTHCAVGQLITQSGNGHLSKVISAEYNLAYLADIKTKGLQEWQVQSGFSTEELAWIQPAYFNPVNYTKLKGGTNGRVNTIVSDNNGGLIAGGNFDTADVNAAGNLANYFSGVAGYDWLGIGAMGLNAQVYDVIWYKGELYVGGIFYQADTVYTGSGVVKWDGNTWEAVGDFYVGALVNYVLDFEIYRDTLYAAGFFRANSTAAKHFESIAKWNGTEWVHAGVDLYGTVNKLHVHDNKLVLGGQFNVNNVANTQNICMIDSTGLVLFNEDLNLEVHDITTYNGELVVATDFMNFVDTMGIAAYRNGTWDVLYDGSSTLNRSTGGVYCLAPYQGTLFFGGEFNMQPFLGNSGKNMAHYKNGNVAPFGYLDSTVHCLKVISDDLYVGGDFIATIGAIGSGPLNHICSVYLPDYLGVENNPVAQSVHLYPNPVADILTIEGLEGSGQYKVYTTSGQFMFEGKLAASKAKIDMSELPRGVYLVEIKTDGKSSIYKKVIRE